MKTHLQRTRAYQFYFPDKDTHVQVEENDVEVVVCASRATFSYEDKLRFIRMIALEGFIADEHQWLSNFDLSSSRLHWNVDPCGIRPVVDVTQRTRTFMFRVLAGAGLFWAFFMAALFLHKL